MDKAGGGAVGAFATDSFSRYSLGLDPRPAAFEKPRIYRHFLLSVHFFVLEKDLVFF